MFRKLCKYLPIDTTAIEAMSGIAFLAYGILNIFNFKDHLTTSYMGFYIFAILFIGIIYSLPVILRDKVRVVRAIMAYLIGVFWMWMGFSTVYGCNQLTLCNIVAFVFGIGNIYAFIIHILLLNKHKI